MDLSKVKTSNIFLRYVIPQMIGLVLNSVYFIVDGIFIGRRLGAQALASAGVAVPVVEITIALSMCISVGAGIVISAAFGQKDEQKARNTFNLSMLFTLGLSVPIAILGNIFMIPLARMLGASDAILPDTVTYLRYFISFSPFLVFSFVLSTFVRNDGRPALAMWSLTIGSLTNIVLDYVLMYPIEMGIGGAALATGLGPVVSVAILLPHFIRKKGRLYFQKPRKDKGLGKRIFINGLPAFIAEFSIGFVTLLYNIAIAKNGLGEQGLASYLVIGYAALICLTAFIGAAQGTQPVVSYWMGAEQFDKIRSLFRASALFNFFLALFFYGVLSVGSNVFFSVFIVDNPALLQFTVDTAKLYFINLPFAALNILLVSFLQSIEKAAQSLTVSVLRSAVFVLAFLTFLPMVIPSSGLWLAVTFAEACTLVIAAVLWRRQWRKPMVYQKGRI